MSATPQTFAQKALARAAGLDAVAVGAVVDARPDVALSHDNSAAILRRWRELGQQRLAIPERIVITLDHAAPAPTPAHALNHAEIRAFVAEQGIRRFYEVGRGICHQVVAEEALALPGQLVLGADSHTPHCGWLGAFGCGIGRTEMAAVWATGELWLRVPPSVAIDLDGTPPPWVDAKDLALALLGLLGTDGALYRAVEIRGDALAALGIDGRQVLANMMAEAGAKTAYLVPDEQVLGTLVDRLARRLDREGERQDRTALRRRLAAACLYPDPGAAYEAVHRVAVSEVEPQVAIPHSPGYTRALSTVGGVRVHQAFLGTCTSGRLGDLAIAAHLLAGRRVAPGTRLLIVPASSRVFAAAARRGYVETLTEAGAVFGPPGCGPCMGNHLGALAPGEVCVSSGNRNYRGRMGTPQAEIYLASPAVVAASAVAGRLVHPAEVAPALPTAAGEPEGAPW